MPLHFLASLKAKRQFRLQWICLLDHLCRPAMSRERRRWQMFEWWQQWHLSLEPFFQGNNLKAGDIAVNYIRKTNGDCFPRHLFSRLIEADEKAKLRFLSLQHPGEISHHSWANLLTSLNGCEHSTPRATPLVC